VFENIKKELLISLIVAMLAGVFGFFLLHLPIEQTLSLGVFLLFILIFLFFMSSKEAKKIKKEEECKVEKVETSSSDVWEEKYHLLEKKYKSVLSKAEKLEKENKTTELFLASMSHEIRTPLNGIVGLTELLDGTELTSEQKEFVSMIRESSHNLNIIVNDILDVSKINAGKMELEHIPFDLFGKIEASVGVFIPKIEEKGIVLNLFTDPKIPHQVVGDPTRFSQVIINLVSNAVKFTERGGKIDVFAQYVKEKEDAITFKISVSDSGIGLTKEQQARIFEAYSQAEASTTRKAGGTGLGLTISSKIIKSMGSELHVQSKEGEGASFFFTLTLPKAKEQTKERVPVSGHLKVGLISLKPHPKSRWSKILQIYIEYYGAEFQHYQDIESLRLHCPDILLIDESAMDVETLKRFEDLSCKRVLMALSTQSSALAKDTRLFDEVVYMPVSFEKISKILQLKKTEGSLAASKTVEQQQEIDKETKSFKDIHVLVAEDNPINQKLIKVVLENFGLTVTMASNGEEALEYFKKEKFDIIFMDIQMPVMGGVEATKHILAYEKANGVEHTPIVALTANALSGDKEKYMAEGMDDYATKPLNIKVIETLVSKYCEV